MSPVSRPIIVELEQVHRCISIAASDKLKGVKIKWLATIGQDEKTVSNMFELPIKESSKILKAMKEDRDVIEVTIVRMAESSVDIIVTYPRHLGRAHADFLLQPYLTLGL